MIRATECRSCHAEIVFGRTQLDRLMPLDAEPVTDGNALLHKDGTVEVLGPLELLLHDREAEPLRMPHHASCPDGERWKFS